MNVLALDLATRTGWALAEDGRIESGVEVFDVKRHESRGMRWIYFNRWLDTVLAGVRLVIYEKPLGRFATSGAAGEIALGMSTRVDEACAARGIEHTALPPATLKKWTTGHGNAKKPDMAAAVHARGWLPTSVTDDNQIDAMALLHYALSELVPAQVVKAPVPGIGVRVAASQGSGLAP